MVGGGDGLGLELGVGVGDGVVGAVAVGVGVVGWLGSWWGLVGRLRSFLRWRIDSFKLVPAARNGAAGWGSRRMWRRSVRIMVSFLVQDVFGMVQLWG